jgi:TolB protein
MAPEQVQGLPVDGQADQYALTCVIVQCLIGEPPFQRENDAATMYAHVHDAPPLIGTLLLGPDARGRALDAAIGRGLDKDPVARFDDCRSLVGAVSAALTSWVTPRSGSSVARPAQPAGLQPARVDRAAVTASTEPAPRRRPRWLLAAVASFVAIAAAAGVWVARVATDGDSVSAAWADHWIARAQDAGEALGLELCASTVRRSDCRPESLQCERWDREGVWADRGALTAVRCGFTDGSAWWNWFLARLPNEVAVQAFHGHDLNYIAKVPMNSGSCDEGVPGEGPWSRHGHHGRVVCWEATAPGETQPRWWLGWHEEGPERVALLTSETSDPLAPVDRKALFDRWASMPPPLGTGRPLAGQRAGVSPSAAGAVEGASATAPTLTPIPPETGPIQRIGGFIVFAGLARGQASYDVLVTDPEGSRPEPLVAGPEDEVQPEVSPDGTLLVYAAGPEGVRDLFLLDLVTGEISQLTLDPADDDQPTWHPNGRAIAWMSTRDGDAEIWTMELTTGEAGAAPLTDDAAVDRMPAWSPNGEQLAFVSDRTGIDAIYLAELATDLEPAAVGAVDVATRWPQWLPHGGLLVTTGPRRDLDLAFVEPPGWSSRAVTSGGRDDWGAAASPGGGALVYSSGDWFEDGHSIGNLVLARPGDSAVLSATFGFRDARDPDWVRALADR